MMDFLSKRQFRIHHAVGRHRHFFSSVLLRAKSNDDVRVLVVLGLVLGGGVKSTTTQGRDGAVDDVPARDDDTFPSHQHRRL